MRRYILDSFSLIAFFERDKGYEIVLDLFDEAINGKVELLMNIINWGEVYYIILREQGSEKADLFEANYEKLPIESIDPNISLVKKASIYKAHNPLSYADCIAAATTDIHKGILVTGDKEFKQLEKDLDIEWL